MIKGMKKNVNLVFGISIVLILLVPVLVSAQDVFELCKSGDIEGCKRLLKEHPERLMLRNGLGATPLHVASEAGQLEMVRMLLSAGAAIDALNGSQRPPLFDAAYRGHKEVVQLLLEKGARRDLRDVRGYTPLNWAAIRRHAEVLDIFMKFGDHPTLFDAAACGHIPLMTRLIAEGADLNQTDDQMDTPLHKAVRGNQLEAVKVLISKTASLNEMNKKYETPLDLALDGDLSESISLLTKYGALRGEVPPPQQVDIGNGFYRFHFPFYMKTNICLFSGSDGLLMIDSGFARRLVDRFRSDVKALGDRSLRYLVNSHSHWDHTAGNGIADEQTVKIDLKGLDAQAEKGEVKRLEGADLPAILTSFDKAYRLEFNADEIYFIPCPGLHSDTDMLIYFNRAGVLHLGDLLLTQNFPANNGPVDDYTAFLERISKAFPRGTVFIGGHGREVDHHGLMAYIDMLKTSAEQVKVAIRLGLSEQTAKETHILREYEADTQFLDFLGVDTWIRKCYASFLPLLAEKLTLSGRSVPGRPFLGQEKPDRTADLFADGLVANSQHSFHTNVVISPDGREVYWHKYNRDRKIDAIVAMKLIDGRWSCPVMPSFSRNSSGDDAPFISPDGQKIYFISERPLPDKPADGRKRIWVSQRWGDDWSPAEPLPEAINSLTGIHWQFSLDANADLYFGCCDDLNSPRRTGKIYHSRFMDGKYQPPVALDQRINRDGEYNTTPFISPDGQVLLFSRESPVTHKMQIYISRKTGASWSEAVSLEPILGPASHNCPIVHAQKGALLFLRYVNSFCQPHWINASALDRLPHVSPISSAEANKGAQS